MAANPETLDYRAGPNIVAGFDIDPETAIEHFRAKGLTPTFAWQDMIGAEHDVAFTVAKMQDVDLLADVRGAVDQAVAEGLPFDQFRDRLVPHLKRKGWWGRRAVTDPMTGQAVTAELGSIRRLQTIFRTNLQSAYSVGSWEKIEAQAEEAPWLRYVAVDDHRVRPEHLRLHNTVLPVTDEFWRQYYPPNGWNCRCGAIQMNDDELAAEGMKPTESAPTAPTREWTNPRTGQTLRVPRDLDPGWNHNPGMARMTQLKQRLQEKLQHLPPDMRPSNLAALVADGPDAQRSIIRDAERAANRAALEQADTVAAQKQLDDLSAGNAPDPGKFKTTALSQLQKTQRWQDAGPQAKLAAVESRAKALKEKHSTQTKLSGYKKNVIAGKAPTPTQQAALDSLPDAERQAFLDKVTDAQKAASAKKALGEIDGPGAPPMKKAALKQLQDSGKAGNMTPVELLGAVEDGAKRLQAKAVQAQALAGYKKQMKQGKTPTEKQTAAFNAQSAKRKEEILAEIEHEKAQAAAQKKLDQYEVQAQSAPEGSPPAAAWKKAQQQPKKATAVQKQQAYEKALAEAEEAQQQAAPAPQSATPEPPPLNPEALTQTGPQRGSNPGGRFRDTETGIEWYIKQADSADNARNEILAGRLYAAAGVEVPDMRQTTFDGQPGIASRMIDGVEKATPRQLAQAKNARENMVVDAWLANWDVVGLEYDNLLVRGGRAVRIDTGGALRYRAQGGRKAADQFTDVVAEIESLRDEGTNRTAYSVFKNTTHEEMVAGARRVVAMDDATIRAIVTQMGPEDVATRDALIARLIARREDIARRFPEARTSRPSAAPAGAGERVSPTQHERITESRQNGYQIETDADLIEDHNVLVWTERARDGTPRTAAQMKLRNDGQRRLDEMVQAVDTTADIAEGTQAALVTAIRGIGANAKKTGLRGVDMERIDAALRIYDDAMARAQELVAAKRLTPEAVEAYRAHYQPWVDYLSDVRQRPLETPFEYASPTGGLLYHGPGMVPGADTTVRIPFVRKEGVSHKLKETRAGRAHETGEDVPGRQVIATHYYEAELDDGTVVRYWDSSEPLAFANRLEVLTPGDGRDSALRPFAVLEELGIDTTPPSDADRVERYLRQIATDQNLRMAELDRRLDVPDQQVRIQRLTEHVNENAGMDVTQSPAWNPHGRREAFDHGKLTMRRPDFVGEDWARFRERYTIHHENTNSEPLPTIIDRILNTGGKMAPTTDKYRRGIPIGGMSADRDMYTGGASYFFTRLRERRAPESRAPGFYWKADAVARTDKLVYDRDMYGDAKRDTRRELHRGTLDKIAKIASTGNNEIDFKDGLSLFDELEHIVAANEEQRQQVIAVFRNNSIDEWPDGRALDAVIVARR